MEENVNVLCQSIYVRRVCMCEREKERVRRRKKERERKWES